MNIQRWVVASIVVTVVVAILEMFIHGFLIQPMYQETASVWRPQTEAQALMPYMWLGYAIFAPFFVWIYAQGATPGAEPIEQGIRFGFMLGLGLSAMNALIWYVVLPIPSTLAAVWFLAGLGVYIAAGVAAAVTYPVAAAARAKSKKSKKKRR